MIRLTADERKIIEQMEERTRNLLSDLELRNKDTPFTNELTEHFRAENKAYKIALEKREGESE